MPVKITELDPSTTITASDLVQIIDVDDPVMSPTGTNKRVTARNAANEFGALLTDMPGIVQTALNSKANLSSPTFTGAVTLPDTTSIGLVSASELARLKGVSGDIQPQLEGKEPTIVSGTTGQYYRGDKTWATLDKGVVGLGNVTNTSDANKPVSTAQQAALDLKANLESPNFTGTVGGITKGMVGLGNVDNTSDANKPVSTTQQTALNLKANLASPTFTGTVTLPIGTVKQSNLESNVVGNGPMFNAYLSANQVLTATVQKVNLSIIGINTNGNFLNSRFTATIAGYYLVSASTYIISNVSGQLAIGLTEIRSGTITPSYYGSNPNIPGRILCGSFHHPVAGTSAVSTVSNIIYFNVGDWIELWTSTNAPAGGSYINAQRDFTYLSCCLIRTA